MTKFLFVVAFGLLCSCTQIRSTPTGATQYYEGSTYPVYRRELLVLGQMGRNEIIEISYVIYAQGPDKDPICIEECEASRWQEPVKTEPDPLFAAIPVKVDTDDMFGH